MRKRLPFAFVRGIGVLPQAEGSNYAGNPQLLAVICSMPWHVLVRMSQRINDESWTGGRTTRQL